MMENGKTFAEIQDYLSRVVLEGDKRKDNLGNVLTYASWSDVWSTLIKVCPTASYEVKKFGADQLPYLKTEEGYMVFTSVTIEGVTREMWLSVMDGHNKAMKSEPYKIAKKNGGEITINAATMTDINYAIMRCLVKNIAMFGLGINFYKGEDLPSGEDVNVVKKVEKIHCEECGKEIVPYKGRSVEQLTSYSQKKFGKNLCAECSLKNTEQKKEE